LDSVPALADSLDTTRVPLAANAQRPFSRRRRSDDGNAVVSCNPFVNRRHGWFSVVLRWLVQLACSWPRSLSAVGHGEPAGDARKTRGRRTKRQRRRSRLAHRSSTVRRLKRWWIAKDSGFGHDDHAVARAEAQSI